MYVKNLCWTKFSAMKLLSFAFQLQHQHLWKLLKPWFIQFTPNFIFPNEQHNRRSVNYITLALLPSDERLRFIRNGHFRWKQQSLSPVHHLSVSFLRTFRAKWRIPYNQKECKNEMHKCKKWKHYWESKQLQKSLMHICHRHHCLALKDLFASPRWPNPLLFSRGLLAVFQSPYGIDPAICCKDAWVSFSVFCQEVDRVTSWHEIGVQSEQGCNLRVWLHVWRWLLGAW